MITQLLLQQFKAHAATRIPLERLTVLVGPNAAGKTSVLEALHLLSQVWDVPEHARGEVALAGTRDLRWVVRRGATEPLNIQISGGREREAWGLWMTAPSDATVDKVKLGWEGQWPPSGAAALRGAVALQLDARRLAEPSYMIEEIPRMRQDGYGLATVLSAIKLASTEAFDALEEAARRIVPDLRRVGFKRTRVEQQAPRALTVEGQRVVVQEKEVVIADELVLDFVDAAGLPAHAASEGTLIVLGLLCAIYSPSRPALLLLDDLDRALHPSAQRALVAGIRAVLDAAPELQIVATTHSPYLADSLRPEEVVVLARGPGGVVAAKRLSEHPKARLLDVLTTGEFWTAEGEDWVAQP